MAVQTTFQSEETVVCLHGVWQQVCLGGLLLQLWVGLHVKPCEATISLHQLIPVLLLQINSASLLTH